MNSVINWQRQYVDIKSNNKTSDQEGVLLLPETFFAPARLLILLLP